MSNFIEIKNAIIRYGGDVPNSNTIKEMVYVLRQIVKEDKAQAENMSISNDSLGLFGQILIYAQRFIEIGYIFTEIYARGEYQNWEPKSSKPRIIDLGGDPGAFSVIYWKFKSPDANIIVVEANPSTAKTMRKVLNKRRYDDVDVINAAISSDDHGLATLSLHQPTKGFHTQDFIRKSNQEDPNTYSIEVPKIKLSTLIPDNENIDLLKIDIEGSELEAVHELSDSGKIQNVSQIIMEFHHDLVLYPTNSLTTMLYLLNLNGFLITSAHITGGGLRSKNSISIKDLQEIATSTKKLFLTISAIRN